MSSITVRAPAKVNLALSVGPPEPQNTPDAGMHPIASWMACVDLFDDVTLEPADVTTLDIRFAEDAPRPMPVGWLHADDLAFRALGRLGEETGRELAAKITIRKRIPVGGGMGGGSVDAAACLYAANRLFDLGLSTDELQAIGRGLGSDVPFFLDASWPARPGVVTHFGERLERVELTPTSLLLVMPGFSCHTGEVYRAYDDAPLTLDAERIAHLASVGEPKQDALFNDLAQPALRSHPALARLWPLVERAAGEPPHLSGSGSTMFFVTDEPEALARELEAVLDGVVCQAARTLTGSETEWVRTDEMGAA